MRTPRSVIHYLLPLLLFSCHLSAEESEFAELKSQLHLQSKRIELLEAALLKLGVEVGTFGEDCGQKDPAKPSEISKDGRDARALQTKKMQSVEREESPAKVHHESGTVVVRQSEDWPVSMKIGGRMQFRYTGFSRQSRTFRFDNGRTGEQADKNEFEIERGRLDFRGYIGRPEIQYYLNLDFDTDDNHDVKAHDFWVNYLFDEAFDLYVGKAFVPGSREWLNGSTTTHLVDRSLATSFFRPDRSIGIWAIGEPLSGFHYRTMVSNGFITTDLESEDVDNQFTYSTSFWGDIIGDYGKGAADLEWHNELAVQVGTSFTYSPIDGSSLGEPIGEADVVRTSDGVRITNPDAVVLGSTISEYDIYLYALDLALKYEGLGINSEFYIREIREILDSHGAELSSFQDSGLTVDAGYFVLPKLFEVVARYSYVDGEVSNASEFAGGFNYYLNGTHQNKISFDVSRIDDSPISSSGPNYLVGETGTLYRLQWQIGF